MNIQYSADRLERILRDFHTATGINLALQKPDFSSFGLEKRCQNRYCAAIQDSALGCARCHDSDIKLLTRCRESRKSEMHICHAGLCDIAVPITYCKTVLGYIILGQIRRGENFDSVKALTADLPILTDEMEAHFKALPLYDEKKIQSIENIAIMLARYILSEGMMKPNENCHVERITDYLDRHLKEPLTVSRIARETNISKTLLYKLFHTYFACTVSEYINRQRVERSLELLSQTDNSVEMIAGKVGFRSAAYYSRCFKKIKGCSPLHFRKCLPELQLAENRHHTNPSSRRR